MLEHDRFFATLHFRRSLRSKDRRFVGLVMIVYRLGYADCWMAEHACLPV